MNAAARERIWIWSTRLVPCAGALVFVAVGWESLPPWHSPASRALPIERGGAPLDRFVVRDNEGDDRSSTEDRAATDSTLDRSPDETGPIARRPVEEQGDDAEASTANAVAEAPKAAEGASVGEDATRYWLNLRSGVRHNPECRYFDPTGDGRYCRPDEGRACRICGG